MAIRRTANGTSSVFLGHHLHFAGGHLWHRSLSLSNLTPTATYNDDGLCSTAGIWCGLFIVCVHSVSHLHYIGPKARFKDPDLQLELDLVYFTDRIIIMGFPAIGVEGLYRNSRSDVKRFLDTRHKDKYHVFNFCPLAENGYPAETFNGRVSRYPFPDHHAPPLPILALASWEMAAWLRKDEENVVVLHCKAGKGRSGTLACALLLYIDGKPMPPKLQRSYNPSEWADNRADELMRQVVIENDDGAITDVARESDAPSINEQEGTGNGESTNKLGVINPTPGSRSPSPSPDISDHEKRKSTAAETLGDILALHTARRMKKSTSHRGVSIASQRRWLRYWSEIVYQVQPPQVWATPSIQRPKAKVHSINIRMRTTGGGAKLAVVRMASVLLDSAAKRRGAASDRGASTIWASLARYEDEFVEELEKKVGSKEETNSMFTDGKYDDRKMVRSFARMGVAEGHTPPVEDMPGIGSVVNYRLHPIPASEWVTVDGAEEQDDFMMSNEVDSDIGITIDAAREVRIKLYNAQVFMGWLWFIPCFHLPQPPIPTAPPVKIVLPRSEVDFPLGFGALLLDVEITLGWTMDESVPSLVPEAEATTAEPSTMGIIAAHGVPEAVRGARD